MSRVLKLGAALAAGAAGAYFLDPENGKRRRNETRDRLLAKARSSAETATAEVGRTATRAQDAAKGAVHEATGESRDPERLNDPALAAKVESEVLGRPEVPKGAISVNVEDRVVYLRGELEDEGLIEAVRAAASEVEGVEEVRSLLHLPGEETPDKEKAGAGPASDK